MFTGLVETIGTLRRRSATAGAGARALYACDYRALVLGESVSVDGACLTVDAIVDGGFEADMSSETLAKTTLGALAVGSKVHLERATPLGGRMGGHVVLGHVDGMGKVLALEASGEAKKLSIEAPGELSRFVAPKGSIAIDGVSLTVNGVRDGASALTFDVMLVPHTLGSTRFTHLRAGDRVNLEVDVLARYVARQLEVAGGMKSAGADLRAQTQHEHDDERILQKLRASGLA